MPVNSPPLLIAALDAGSNAIRAVVARASSATEIRELANARWTVRLGHGVFTKRRMDPRTMSRAVETFVQFRNMLDRYGVAEYSAVATSAVREAANRGALVSRILREAGIELMTIDAAEEARRVVGLLLGPSLIWAVGAWRSVSCAEEKWSARWRCRWARCA